MKQFIHFFVFGGRYATIFPPKYQCLKWLYRNF